MGDSLHPPASYDPDRCLAARPVTDAEVEQLWPRPWRAVERREDGTLLSFFTADDEHVVTQAKEVGVLRPHGTILRTGDTAAPDPRSLTVTCWMTGSPLSYLTRGNASDGRVLTTVRGYLGLHPDHGVRVLVEVADRWRLLGLPSAFAMTLDGARWVHVLDPDGEDAGGVVEVRTTAAPTEHGVRMSVRVTSGPQRRVMLALHLATGDDPLPAPPGVAEVHERSDGIAVVLPTGTLPLRSGTPLTVGDDGPLFDDGAGRSSSVVTLRTEPGPGLDVEVTVEPAGAAREPGRHDREAATEPERVDDWWPTVTALRVGGAGEAEAESEALDVSLPWLVRDALVHFLSPRGLEQYSGGAWGTRDVAQGPVELLLALDRQADVRALLLRILAAQNTDGTWPQAFGFLPGDEQFRMEPPHGDVVHWPVLAVGRYLQASGDATLLDEKVPWYAPADADPEPASTVRTHVERALEVAREHFLPGTSLVAYGHGDWNDSLQPADPAMAVTMCSSWTVTLHHQSLRTLADGLETVGGEDVFVAELRAQASAVADDLRRHLLVDGELAGYAQLDPPDRRGLVAGQPPAGAPAGQRDRAAARLAADDPRPRRRPPRPRAGRPPRRAGPRAPHGGGRHPAVRPATALLRWADEPLPARGDGDVRRPGDRADVRARAPALVRGDGPLGRRRRALAGARCRCCPPPRWPWCPEPDDARRTPTRRARTRPASTGTSSPPGTPRCSRARRAWRAAGGSTRPGRGCCCGSSSTRCSGCAGAPGRSRSTPSSRPGWTG